MSVTQTLESGELVAFVERIRREFAQATRVLKETRTLSATMGATGGRPMCLPSALALAIPDRTRSRMIARSNSANTDSMPNMARPAGVASDGLPPQRGGPLVERRAVHTSAKMFDRAIEWTEFTRMRSLRGSCPGAG